MADKRRSKIFEEVRSHVRRAAAFAKDIKDTIQPTTLALWGCVNDFAHMQNDLAEAMEALDTIEESFFELCDRVGAQISKGGAA